MQQPHISVTLPGGLTLQQPTEAGLATEGGTPQDRIPCRLHRSNMYCMSSRILQARVMPNKLHAESQSLVTCLGMQWYVAPTHHVRYAKSLAPALTYIHSDAHAGSLTNGMERHDQALSKAIFKSFMSEAEMQVLPGRAAECLALCPVAGRRSL